jgi:hypothetical protein
MTPSVFTNASPSNPEQARAYTSAVLDLVGEKEPFEILTSTPAAIGRIIDGLSRDELSHPEAEGKWSIDHVLEHLVDSEIIWGFRLRMALGHDRPTLMGFDQDLFAERLDYAGGDATEALADLTGIRAANLRLLRRMTDEAFRRVGLHSERGEESVAHMVRMFSGHDLLHLRQLERIRRSVRSAG